MSGEQAFVTQGPIVALRGVDAEGNLRNVPAAGRLGPPNRRVACLGDSISQHNTINAATNWTGQYGNRYISFGYLSWLRFLSNQAFDFDGNSNFGVVGDTLPLIQARTDVALAASDAGTWFVMGGINDTALTIGQSQDALRSIVQKILNAGRIVVLMVPPPSGDSGNTGQRMTATRLKVFNAFRRWMLYTYSSAPGVYVVDMWPALGDFTSTIGDNIVGRTYDGLHPSPEGAFRMAKMLLPVVNLIFPKRNFLPSSSSDLYDATDNPKGCVTPNPYLTGTAGTAGTGGSGNIADSWSGTNSGLTGLTRVYSKIAAATGFGGVLYDGGITKDWQQCVIGNTPSGNADASILFLTSPAGLAIGDTVQGVAEIEVDSGTAGMDSLFLRLYNNSDFTIGGIDGHYSGSMGNLPADAFAGTLLTPPVLLTATTMTFALSFRCKSAVATTMTMRVRGIGLFKV